MATLKIEPYAPVQTVRPAACISLGSGYSDLIPAQIEVAWLNCRFSLSESAFQISEFPFIRPRYSFNTPLSYRFAGNMSPLPYDFDED